jgi:hypothetical protein
MQTVKQISWILAIALLFLGACEQKSDQATKESETPSKKTDVTDDSSAGSLALDNSLAEAYPVGLSVAAYSTDTSDSSEISSAGSLAIDDDASLALLEIFRPSLCPATGTKPAGCLEPCIGGATTNCILTCPQSNPPQGCLNQCPANNPPERCYYPPGATPADSTTVNSTTQQVQQPSGGGDQNMLCNDDPDLGLQSQLGAQKGGTSILSGSKLDRAPKQVLKNVNERLRGKADCVSDDFEDSIKLIKEYGLTENITGESCYGPDWAITKKNFGDTDDVCMVGFVRNEAAKMNAYVTFSQRMVEAMICQAGVNGLAKEEIPEGKKLDLGSSLSQSINIANMTIKSATLARDTNARGRKIYHSKAVVSIIGRDPSGQNFSFDLDLGLSHSPGVKGNDSYDGVLSISHLMPQDGTNPQGKKSMSLSYARAESKNGARVIYDLRSGQFHKDLKPYNAKGEINFNVNANFAGTAGSSGYGAMQSPAGSTGSGNYLAQRMKHVHFDGYPDLGAHRMSYWVNFGEQYYETSRGFVFETKIENGEIRGCGIVGATAESTDQESSRISIRRAQKEKLELKPKAFWRPFMCTESLKTGPGVWQQCFKRNANGAYVLDTERTTDVTKGFDFIQIDRARVRPPVRIEDNKQVQGVFRKAD